MYPGQYYFLRRKLEKQFDEACKENEKAYDRIITIEKKKEISKLVNCLKNYLELRILAENY